MPVPECSLDQSEVPTLAIKSHGKGMPGRVDRQVTLDASFAEPVVEANLYLATTEVATATGGE